MRRLDPTRFSTGLAMLFVLTQCGDSGVSQGCAPGDVSCTAGTGASATMGGATGGAPQGVGGSTTGVGGGTAMPSGGAGTIAAGGSTGGAQGNTGGQSTSPDVDQEGVGLASPGDETHVPSDYLNLGDMRLLANRWGSDERGCDTALRVFVNADQTFGWDFDRGACGGEGAQPDFPEVEFGIHPFGIGSPLETSPPFSSTAMMPIQVKDITSASIEVANMSISLQSAQAWNIAFEFWLSERNPVTDPNPGVHAEILGMWGWQGGRWPCGDDNNPDSNEYAGDNVTAGDRTYNLCHQRDDWADGQWRYFQFRMQGGPTNSFSGRVDVKSFLDWLISTRGYSSELWVTRFEVGSEIDDDTRGTVTISDITFEVNGDSASARLAP